MKIHPSALVDPAGKIAEDVEIGPCSVVGPKVEIGAGSILQSHVVLEGAVTIGQNNLIGHGAVIGAPPQDLSFSPDRKTGVRIGNDNVIREYCTFHRGTTDGSETTIGNKNYFMVGAHLGHNCAIGNGVTIANNCLLAGYVQVSDQAFLGGACSFHQHMRVGRLAMIQGSSAFGKDLPPFTLAAERNSVMGLNIVGLRRAGFSLTERQDIKSAFKLVYLSGLNLSQAMDRAATMEFGPLGQEFLRFITEAKKRGICPYRGKGEGSLEL